MTFCSLRHTALSVPLALAAATAAVAQDAPPIGFSVGLGAAIPADPFVGDAGEAEVLPLLRYQGHGFSLGTDGLRFDLRRDGGVTVEAVLLPRFTALDDPDGAELNGIDRDITGDLGLSFSADLRPGLAAEIVALQEVTGEHDGQELILGLRQDLPLGGLPVSVGAGVSWKSADLTNYLYGVRTDEALAGRPAYRTSASLTPFLALEGAVPISQRVVVVGGARVEFLEDDVTDSPIVDDDVAASGFIGLLYRF